MAWNDHPIPAFFIILGVSHASSSGGVDVMLLKVSRVQFSTPNFEHTYYEQLELALGRGLGQVRVGMTRTI
ncbi:hypothetical protein C8R43DRAFT_985091 [Mycena crocata]|nr:hypothetical protein C8R43DRAFT_985091 [Mycena crocata]